jgi:TatD DNase family protein
MYPVPFVDIHTHPNRNEPVTIIVQNIFPGEEVADFTGRNFYSVGLHPWYIKSEAVNDVLISMVKETLENDHVCFVGECGLDKLAKTSFDEQIRVFRAHVVLAEEWKRPVIIHCVRAYNEILELHVKIKPEIPWILHGYTGGPEITKRLAKRGFYFSFGKSLFNPKSKSIESLRWLPLDRIFFETDEFKGNVDEVYQHAAILKEVSPELLKQEVWNNFNIVESSLVSINN